jgi:hypothetical protein
MKGNGSGLIEVLPRHLYGTTDENHDKHIKISGVPADIRTAHLPTTTLERVTAVTTCSVEKYNLVVYNNI